MWFDSNQENTSNVITNASVSFKLKCFDLSNANDFMTPINSPPIESLWSRKILKNYALHVRMPAKTPNLTSEKSQALKEQ